MSTADIKALSFWLEVQRRLIKSGSADLSTRQLAILLTIYVDAGPHTPKKIAAEVKISKAATSRAISTLCRYGFIKRKQDENDRRVTHLQRTVSGSVYLSELATAIAYK
jgi:DNA-binding MarR family transcriptional regulator